MTMSDCRFQIDDQLQKVDGGIDNRAIGHLELIINLTSEI
jgi:hypothetical protein